MTNDPNDFDFEPFTFKAEDDAAKATESDAAAAEAEALAEAEEVANEKTIAIGDIGTFVDPGTERTYRVRITGVYESTGGLCFRDIDENGNDGKVYFSGIPMELFIPEAK